MPPLPRWLKAEAPAAAAAKHGKKIYTNIYVCTKNFNRTELRIGVSKANNFQESFAEVHFCVAPQEPDNNTGKQISESAILKTKMVLKNEMMGID